MERHVQHPRVVVEDVLHAVPVVHVDVHVGDSLHPGVEQVTDRQGELRYSCQATEVFAASSSALRWWDVRPFWTDLRSGNVRPSEMARGFLYWLFLQALRVGDLPRTL